MNIETLAVSAVQQRLAWCERLDPQLATHDKVINSDGVIQLYSGSSRDKASHRGHAQIQIKGRRSDSRFTDTATFSVGVEDLRGYLKERGLVFVLALINLKAQETALYYIVLNPFKIMDFIKKAGDQKTIRLRLIKLPEDPDELTTIFFYSHTAQQEDPSNHDKQVTLREGLSLEVFSTRDLEFNRPLNLTRDDGIDFTVFRTDEDGVRTPIDAAFEFVPPNYVDHELDLTISSSTVRYERFSGRLVDDKTLRADLSENLYIIFTRRDGDGDMDVSVTIQSGGSVASYARDLAFYIECIDDGKMWVDGVLKDFSQSQDSSDMRAQQEALKDISEALAALNIDPHRVPIEDLTDQVQKDLQLMRRGLVDGEEIAPAIASSGRLPVGLGPWRVEVLAELSEKSQKWILHNPFDEAFSKHYYTSDEEPTDDTSMQPVTPFDMLSVEDVKCTINLNLGKLVEIYGKLPDTDARVTLASNFVLKLLLAADASELRRDEFLDAAASLNAWILSAGAGADDSVHQINQMQVKARRSTLEETEQKELRAMRRAADKGEDSTSREIGYCCSILLGDREEALDRRASMPEEDRAKVDSWPITALLHPAPPS